MTDVQEKIQLRTRLSRASRQGGTVVSTAASQRQGPGFDSRLGSLSVRSLHALPVSAWVSSRCSNFLPRSNDVRAMRIGHAKLPLSIPRYLG